MLIATGLPVLQTDKSLTKISKARNEGSCNKERENKN